MKTFLRLFFQITALAFWGTGLAFAQSAAIRGGFLNDLSSGNGGAGFHNKHTFVAHYFVENQDVSKIPSTVKATIYRKRDNQRVADFTMTQQASVFNRNTAFPNPCDVTINIQTVTLSADYQFETGLLNDQQGYYITTEPVCCRQNTDNLAQSNAPIVHYMEIGAVNKVPNTPINPHTPQIQVFSPLEYCIDQEVSLRPRRNNSELFTFRYAMADPLTGLAEKPFGVMPLNAGFTSQNFTGNAASLQIDPVTGFISGRTEKPGKYSFVMRMEAYIKGEKYSEVRQEFQFIVKNCRQQITPRIVISEVNNTANLRKNDVCQDSLVQLNLTNYSPGGKFQWQAQGQDLAGATDSVFRAPKNRTATYTCVVSNPLLCPQKVSVSVEINYLASPNVTLTASVPSGDACAGGAIKLTASTSNNNAPNQVFEWLRDNKPIANATQNTYETTQSGNYAVRITDANGCKGQSEVQMVATNAPPKAEIVATKRVVCAGETLRLAAVGEGQTYQWLRDGQPILGATQSVYNAAVAGTYSLKITAANGCSATSSGFLVRQVAVPVVEITPQNNQTTFCEGTTTSLRASAHATYQWLRDAVPVAGATASSFTVSEAGKYAVQVTDTNNCVAMSAGVTLQKVTKIAVKLDSIPPFCGSNQAPVLLKGTPSGGEYTGVGVQNGQFNPAAAGVGTFVVAYNVRSMGSCGDGTVSRQIVVLPMPKLNLGPDRELLRGGSLRLDGDIGRSYTYQWTPPVGLDNSLIASPVASPNETTTYQLTATGPGNCVAADTIRITVTQGVFVPNVFSPNGDTQNDSWELKGLEAYPEAEVWVFDRWGQVVYHEQGLNRPPFDGNYRGSALPVGSYAYKLRLKPNAAVYQGVVLLLR